MKEGIILLELSKRNVPFHSLCVLVWFQTSTGAGFLLDSMFDFAERFNKLCLRDEELALFSAVVLMSPGRWHHFPRPSPHGQSRTPDNNDSCDQRLSRWLFFSNIGLIVLLSCSLLLMLQIITHRK